MTEQKPKKKGAGGRPKKEIDYALVEKLAHIHCTQEEIAEVLSVSVKTLQRNKEFCRIYKKGISSGKMSLRRQQWEAVERGNTTMLIWLGKQYLEQRDDADMNALKKEELALKKKELEKEKTGLATPDLAGFVEALKGDVQAVFDDEED